MNIRLISNRFHVLSYCLLFAAVAIGCERSAPIEQATPPPDLYRSKTSARHVEFEGIAGELREAMLERDLLVRTERVAGLLQRLSPESAEQVLEVFETVWLDLGQTELELLGDWWARFDPHRAIEWAESDMRTARTQVPYAVMRAWARWDPRAAASRAVDAKEKDPTLRATYEAAVIEGWEDSGQPGIVAYIQDLGPGFERQRALRGLTRRMVLRDGPDAAFRWADALPVQDKLFRLNALRRVTKYAAKLDPVLAAKYVEQYEGTYYMRSLPQRVAIQWARKDPEAMMRWLASLANGRDRDEGVREGFRTWARRDYEAAVAWLHRGEHERYKDEAAALVARRLQIGEPERAIEIAQRIVKNDLRVGTLIVVARSWGVQDERAAVDWANGQSGLTPKEKELAQSYGELWRGGVVAAMEKRAKLDEAAAKARLDDFADPDLDQEETQVEAFSLPGSVQQLR